MRSSLTLLGICLAFFIGNLDITGMNVVVAPIHQDFSAPLHVVSWILSGYMLGFSAFLVAAGRLSDCYTHRRMFLIGLLSFVAVSLIGGLSVNITMLIVCRIVQGVVCALFWPSVVALVLETAPEGKQSSAMGWLLGTAGLAMASGPIIGGACATYASWRWVLLLNVPIGLIAAGLVWRLVPAKPKVAVERNDKAAGFDFLGMILVAIASASFLASVNQMEIMGFHGVAAGLFYGFLLSLFLFIWHEKSTKKVPLVDLQVLKNRVFVSAVFLRMAIMFCYVVLLFLLGLYFEKVLHYSAVKTGLYFLPLMLTTAIVSPIAGKMAGKLGVIRLMLIGTLLVALGVWLMTLQRDIEVTYWTNGWRLFVIGLGLGLTFPTTTLVAVSALPKAFAGLASALFYMFALMAGSAGVVIAGAMVKTNALQLIYQNFLRLGVSLDAQGQQQLTHAVNQLQAVPYLQAHYTPAVLDKMQPSITHLYAYSFASVGTIAWLFCLVAFAIMALTAMLKRD